MGDQEVVAARASAPARVVIVDDHELARAGLRAMLTSEPDLVVVGEASDGAEALERCRALAPDLVLMDVRMPTLDGLEATRAIKGEFPGIAVIIVTIYENPDYLFRALKAGAAGYVLKDATQRQVVTAIRQVLRRELLLNPEVMTRLLGRLASEDAAIRHSPAEHLTPREAAVLRLLARGQTNREIAASLGVAVGTVKVHVERIIAKLAVSDRTQAAVRAVQLGLLATEPD
jgi:DNA-binding NarL/FixJ family response regulator